MEQTTETTKAPSIQDHVNELHRWLAERNLVLGVVAQGVRTNALTPIEDFMPANGSHVATWALQFKQQQQP